MSEMDTKRYIKDKNAVSQEQTVFFAFLLANEWAIKRAIY